MNDRQPGRDRPTIVVLSHVPPVPRDGGQRQRVYYTLQALRERFYVTLCVSSEASDAAGGPDALTPHCDDLVVLPPRVLARWGNAGRTLRMAIETCYAVATGLKRSNHRISRDFSVRRLRDAGVLSGVDCVLFEYWHASRSSAAFSEHAVVTVLDLHDILWRSRERGLATSKLTPRWYARRAADSYRRREEAAWHRFDVLIAINQAEQEEVQEVVANTEVLYVPMGIPLADWPYRSAPASPPRIAYYGGLGSRQREIEVLRVAEAVMPIVWESAPATELWIVGSHPTDAVRRLASDPRITVTGYVEDAGAVLATMSAVVCPFSGRFGFRSRLIEIMATGVPVVATYDAVHGMALEHGEGVLLGEDDTSLARHCLRLLQDEAERQRQSRRARQAAAAFTFESTYGFLADSLVEALRTRRR